MTWRSSTASALALKREHKARYVKEAISRVLGLALSEIRAQQQQELSAKERIHDNFLSLVGQLVSRLGTKDLYTSYHSFFVMRTCINLAKKFDMSGDRLTRLETASLLHDIVKIGLPYSVINKSGRLTNNEFSRVKKHPLIGSRILGSLDGFSDVDRIIRHHHERYDGMGYPYGLTANEIPLEARLIAAADSYHAMASKRSYKDSMDDEYIVKEFRRCSGTQFDPEIAEAFIAMMQDDDDFAKYRRA